MKKTLVLFGLLLSSPLLYAYIGCKYLGVSVTNASDHDCVLKNVTVWDGSLNDEGGAHLPFENVSKGTTSPTFYFLQSMSGVYVILNYRCDNKPMAVTLIQGRCGLSAGDILFIPSILNELHSELTSQVGSNWSSKPGLVHWKIY